MWRLVLLCVFAPAAAQASASLPLAAFAPRPSTEVVSVLIVGDVALNRNGIALHPDGVREGNGVYPWSKMTEEIRPLLNTDIRFMNLETVVTSNNDLKGADKRQRRPYLFRSHPKGVKHLLDIGFDTISLANNHSFDFDTAGVEDTLKHLKSLAKTYDINYAGVGKDCDTAAAPVIFRRKGRDIAFSSIGILTSMNRNHRCGDQKPGSLGYRYAEDWARVLRELREATADLKLLSVHYGIERQIRTDERQRKQWRDAVAQHDVDVVIGHHAHVVRGIEIHKGKPIFYGLGNFLIRGAANMGSKARLRVCCDFGLAAKVYFIRNGGVDELAAIEAFPVYDMHRRPRPLTADEAKKRIEVVNHLAKRLDGKGSTGVRFYARKDGTGLFCTKLGKSSAAVPICSDFKGPSKVSDAVAKRVDRYLGRKSRKRRKHPKRRKKRR